MTDETRDRTDAIALAASRAESSDFRDGLARLVSIPTDATAPGAETVLDSYLDVVAAMLEDTGFAVTRTTAGMNTPRFITR